MVVRACMRSCVRVDASVHACVTRKHIKTSNNPGNDEREAQM